MLLSFVNVRIATNAEFLHLRLKIFNRFHRYQVILRAEKNNPGRIVTGNIMRWRKLLITLTHALISVVSRTVVEDGIKENHGVGFRRNGKIVLWIVATFGHSHECCK